MTLNVNVQELDHTSAQLAAMDASHERLAKSKEEYEKQTPLLTKSRRLLSKMSWHSVLDSITLYGCLAIFFLVVAYILQKRLIYFVPSFLIPSFGKSPGALRQSPAVDLQSPAGLPPSTFGNSPGSAMGPSAAGPPSNDRWYEAQPGYDGGEKIRDDRWYEAQPNDTAGPDSSAGFGAHQQPVGSHQQPSASNQHTLQQQQQQRQLEEAYREASAQHPAPQPSPLPDTLTHHAAGTGRQHQQNQPHMPSDTDFPEGDVMSWQQAADAQMKDASTQIPLSRSDRPRPIQVGMVPRMPAMTATPAPHASQAASGIRQGLEEASMPHQPRDASQAATVHEDLGWTPISVAGLGELGVQEAMLSSGLAGIGATDQTDHASDQPQQQQQQQQDLETHGDSLPTDEASTGLGLSPDLDTYPGLEKATEFAKATDFGAQPEPDEADSSEVLNATASSNETIDLDTHPGLEQASIPDAAQATDAAGDDLLDVDGIAAANLTLHGDNVLDVDSTSAEKISLQGAGLSEDLMNASGNSSTSKAGPDMELQLNETERGSSAKGGVAPESDSDDALLEPGTPSQGHEAGLFQSASTTADGAANESSSPDSWADEDWNLMEDDAEDAASEGPEIERLSAKDLGSPDSAADWNSSEALTSHPETITDFDADAAEEEAADELDSSSLFLSQEEMLASEAAGGPCFEMSLCRTMVADDPHKSAVIHV